MPSKSKQKHRSVSTSTTPTHTSKAASTTTPAAASTASKTMGKSFSTEFNPDYTFVKQDLRRIGTLAGIFFVVLVVLSFFLR